MTKCNTHIEDADVHEKDLSIGITFHHLGLILAAVSGLIAIILAQYLIFQHAIHYSKPWEQRHIIRILFMIPVYAAVSFLSYYYFHHAIYFEVLRDCYEAFAIASFFTLLCSYITPSLHDQKEYFRATTPKNWIWPLPWLQKCTGGRDKGILRAPRSGLTWFNIIHVGVFQYCFIRVFFTIVSVIAQANGVYCDSSLSPAFAHIWVLVFESVSVSVAMYTLIQFYVQLKTDLAQQKPFLKLLCIKLVIFFSFWQNLVISFLSSKSGPLKPTAYISWPDISVGIPSVLLTCEMAIFAVLHLFAFPYRKPYGKPSKHSADHEVLSAPGSDLASGKPQYGGGFLGWKAILDAFNPWDIVKASARGFRWLFVGVRHRHQDSSYQRPDAGGIHGPYNHAADAAAAHGYAPTPNPNPSFHLYDSNSTKLQPIGGAWPLSDNINPHNTAYHPPGATLQPNQNTAYGGPAAGIPNDERIGRWSRQPRGSAGHGFSSTEDPWTTDGPAFTPSPSPSPAPATRAQFQPYGDDRQGLLQYAGSPPGVGAGGAGGGGHGVGVGHAHAGSDESY